MITLGFLVFILYVSIFLRFMYKYHNFTTRENGKSNICFLVIWFLLWLPESLFLTFIRPAGEISFMGQDLDQYANENNTFLASLRKYFQVNENVQLFVMGMFIIRIFTFFGKKYKQSMANKPNIIKLTAQERAIIKNRMEQASQAEYQM